MGGGFVWAQLCAERLLPDLLCCPYSLVMQPNPNHAALRIIVAAALVHSDGSVLLQQRPAGKAMAGLWEFPGGKVEAGEHPEAALVRELEEELAIELGADDLAPLSFATEVQGDAHMVLLLYLVRHWRGTPQALAADALKWVRVDDMHQLPMPPADVPLVEALKKVL